VKFRDTRPEPKDGSEDKRTAGQIIAAAFAGGGAVRLPRGFGGKDPHRTPMNLRYQAALRGLLAEAHKGNRARLAKRTVAVEVAP
jgi:hypothetical protein